MPEDRVINVEPFYKHIDSSRKLDKVSYYDFFAIYGNFVVKRI